MCDQNKVLEMVAPPSGQKMFMKAREIHKRLNIEWLAENDFIKFADYPITTQYKLVK